MSGENESGTQVGRREAIRWIAGALATITFLDRSTFGAEREPQRYGFDPNLVEPKITWDRTLTAEQRRAVSTLCDLILPADERSPSASAVGVPDFIDEWISAPYPDQQRDRQTVLNGLEWLDAESRRRYGKPFVELNAEEQTSIADDICYPPRAQPEFREAARFFSTFRNLTLGGFYTTDAGRKDVGYVGNTPLPKFDGPPPEVLRHLGLA